MNSVSEDKELLMRELIAQGIEDTRVIDAIKKVSRRYFVSDDSLEFANKNIPLPILEEQTISQPFTVAYMLELLDVRYGDSVLEIGTGSGYNAALLRELSGERGRVYSIEIKKSLCDFARKNFDRAGVRGVEIIQGDGYVGYKKKSPFDRIIITAAVKKIPVLLLNQLSEFGGILVAPVEDDFGNQVMTRVVKTRGDMVYSEHGLFRFVPMVGEILKDNF